MSARKPLAGLAFYVVVTMVTFALAASIYNVLMHGFGAPNIFNEPFLFGRSLNQIGFGQFPSLTMSVVAMFAFMMGAYGVWLTRDTDRKIIDDQP